MEQEDQHIGRQSPAAWLRWTCAVSALLLAAASMPAHADALDKMALVFEGNPSRSDIAQRVSSALRTYGESNTEENRSRLGSVLVVMRKKHGVPEMDILRCMIADRLPVKIQEAAALCTVTLIRD